MDYPVSDILNSNIPARCLKYDFGVSRQSPIMCGTCRGNVDCQVVNNNSLSQTRADSSSMSDCTRCQWSSRAQQSLCQTPSTQHSQELTNIRRSRSGANYHSASHDSTYSINRDHMLFSKEQNCRQDTRHFSQTDQSSNPSSRARLDYHYSCDSSQDTRVSSHTDQSCTSSSRARLDYHYSCESHSTLNITDRNNNNSIIYLNDGQSSWADPVCNSLSSEESVCSNIWSTNDKTNCGQNTLESFNLSPCSSKTPALRNRVALEETTIISEHIQSPEEQHGYPRKSRGLIIHSFVSTPKDVVSVKRTPDFSRFPNISEERVVITGQPGIETTHNRQLIQPTTTSSKRNSNMARSPRKIHAIRPLHALPGHDIRDSDKCGTSYPRFLAPNFPVPSLLPEEFYHTLDFDYENGGLTAEVVLSLHFRNYQIKEVLGKGISSTVRRVVEKSTAIEYAVKIIDISGENGELISVEQVKKDTFSEISVLRMCAGHSNIIELHDVFETSTFIFLVFEICKQGELFDYLTSLVSLSEKRTRIFMRQLIEAVAFFHNKNIVHRDLKPENILLDDALNIKVSDFGFAVVLRNGEQLSELCGTPGYLAPEVLARSMYDDVPGYGKEVDMWACGVIMYTLLCGAPPFWNRRQMMMLRSIMAAEYSFNSPEWDDISETSKDLIRNLLVVNPKDRLTAHQALKHTFFVSQLPETRFQALRKFKAGVGSVMFMHRLSLSQKPTAPVLALTVHNNPYGVKIMRKVIDTCAFSMYKHWVKRVDNQNRAAMFEHTLRDDWKLLMVTANV